MALAFQPSFAGLTLPAARPLIPVEVAMVLLDRDEDEVLAAIESGVLGWAWNIGCPNAERRELRIWRDSLLALLEGRRQETGGPEGRSQEDSKEQKPLSLEEILRGVLPNRPVRSTELQRFFSCSSTHITHLLRDGCLTAAGRRQRDDGPNSFTRITRDSVVKFLTDRREAAAPAGPRPAPSS